MKLRNNNKKPLSLIVSSGYDWCSTTLSLIVECSVNSKLDTTVHLIHLSQNKDTEIKALQRYIKIKFLFFHILTPESWRGSRVSARQPSGYRGARDTSTTGLRTCLRPCAPGWRWLASGRAQGWASLELSTECSPPWTPASRTPPCAAAGHCSPCTAVSRPLPVKTLLYRAELRWACSKMPNCWFGKYTTNPTSFVCSQNLIEQSTVERFVSLPYWTESW